jgi:hypothetical protein
VLADGTIGITTVLHERMQQVGALRVAFAEDEP